MHKGRTEKLMRNHHFKQEERKKRAKVKHLWHEKGLQNNGPNQKETLWASIMTLFLHQWKSQFAPVGVGQQCCVPALRRYSQFIGQTVNTAKEEARLHI